MWKPHMEKRSEKKDPDKANIWKQKENPHTLSEKLRDLTNPVESLHKNVFWFPAPQVQMTIICDNTQSVWNV